MVHTFYSFFTLYALEVESTSISRLVVDVIAEGLLETTSQRLWFWVKSMFTVPP